MNNLLKLQSIANSLDFNMNKQTQNTRTRASLLEIKKLCDTVRKELLSQNVTLKQQRKQKKSGSDSESSSEMVDVVQTESLEPQEPEPVVSDLEQEQPPLVQEKTKKRRPVTRKSQKQ